MKRLVCTCLAFALLLTGCVGKGGAVQYSEMYVDTFDTVVQLIAYDSDEQHFREQAAVFHRLLQEYDRLYDIYTAYDGVNNLYEVNRQAGLSPVKVDDRILDLLEFGKEVYTLSDGKVNIAAGAVLSLWHEARTAGLNDPAKAALPDVSALTEAAKHTAIEDVIIDREAGTVFLRDPAMSLDVGAIAKGYATERLCRWLEQNAWSQAAMSAGGNVRTVGSKDGGAPWVVGVENPDRDDGQAYVATLCLTGQALVTSGDYQRTYTVNGTDYHHIIDPATCMPATYVHSTTVLCDDSGLADALSTALFLMPVADGQALVASLDGVEALWVTADYQTIMTDGFKAAQKEE